MSQLQSIQHRVRSTPLRGRPINQQVTDLQRSIGARIMPFSRNAMLALGKLILPEEFMASRPIKRRKLDPLYRLSVNREGHLCHIALIGTPHRSGQDRPDSVEPDLGQFSQLFSYRPAFNRIVAFERLLESNGFRILANDLDLLVGYQTAVATNHLQSLLIRKPVGAVQRDIRIGKFKSSTSRRLRIHRSGMALYPIIVPKIPAADAGLQSESCPQRVAISRVREKSPSP